MLGPIEDCNRPYYGKCIVVDDASPDTCLALIALARRISGLELETRWIEYSIRWERGYTDIAATPDVSFGALLSALGHVDLQNSVGHSQEDASTAHRAALLQCVRYAEGLINLNVSPTCVPRHLENAPDTMIELHDRAHSRLAYEAAVYRQIKSSATRLQLAVHLAGSRRKTVVDAIFFTEKVLTSSLKVFARSDAETFSGHGFSFQATYRPDLPMTGNDITISTDPLQKLDLRDLWLELERLEEIRWRAFANMTNGFPRPRGNLGSGDRILPSHRENWSTAEPCHQPWYDEMGRRSLLAAPRGVERNGTFVPGTQLSWKDVKEAIWRVYAPTLGLRLRPLGGEGAGCRLTDSPAETSHLRAGLADGLALFVVAVERVNSHPDNISLWTPTLSAACAAFIQTGTTSIDALAPAGSFDLVEERGGLAIISDYGAMFVQMSPDKSFPVEAAVAGSRKVAAKVKSAVDMEVEIGGRLRKLVEQAIGSGTGDAKREALKALFEQKMKVRRAWRDAQNLESDPLAHRLRNLCEMRWRARERLDSAISEIEELERMVVSSSEIRANEVLNSLAIYGLPASLAGNLLGGLIILSEGRFDGIAWSVLGIYVLVTLGLGAIIAIFAKVQQKEWKLSAPNDERGS